MAIKFIKSDIKKAIRNAETLHLIDGKGLVNVIHPKKGEDFTDFVKKGLETEYKKLVIYHKNGRRTEIEVINS